MKGIILAAGSGSRMRASSNDETPKQLRKLGSETLIDSGIKMMRLGGVRDVLVVLGYEADRIIAESGILHRLETNQVKVIVNKDWATTDTDYSLNLATEFVSDEPFIVTMGDTVVHPGLYVRLVDTYKSILTNVVVTESILRLLDESNLEGTQIISINNEDPKIVYKIRRGYLPGANCVESGVFAFDHMHSASTVAGKLQELANAKVLYALDCWPWYTYNVNTLDDLNKINELTGEVNV